jgi:hypothetical protein
VRRRAAPRAREGAQPHAAAVHADEAVGAGADRLRDLCRRIARHDVEERQLVEQHRRGAARADLDGVAAQLAHRVDADEVVGDAALGVMADAVERRHHVVGGERASVVEAHVRPQVEAPGEVVGALPARRQRGLHAQLGVEGHQRVVDVLQHREGEHLVVEVRVERQRRRVGGDAQRPRRRGGRWRRTSLPARAE